MSILRVTLYLAVILSHVACSQIEVRKTPQFSCGTDIQLGSTVTGKVADQMALAEFYEKDREVAASIYCSNISGDHTLKWQWRDPNGNIYTASNPVKLSVSENSYSPSARVKHSININSERAASLPGIWQVRAYLDDTLLSTRQFSLVKLPDDLFDQVMSLPPAKPNEDKFAVVIGIENYLDTPAARFAERDAEIMRELFIRRFGIPEQNITMLINEKVSLGVMRNLFGNKLHSLPDNAVLYVFYSGHGAPLPSGESGETASPYILPYDGTPTNLANTGYSLQDFYAALDRLPVRNVFVFIDACFSGATGRVTGEKIPLTKDVKAVELYVKDPAIVSKKVISIASSQGTQISNGSERDRLGLFTSQLVKGLVDQSSPLSDKKRITVQELYGYLKENTEKESRKIYGLSRVQVPSLKPAQLDDRSRLTIVNTQ